METLKNTNVNQGTLDEALRELFNLELELGTGGITNKEYEERTHKIYELYPMLKHD